MTHCVLCPDACGPCSREATQRRRVWAGLWPQRRPGSREENLRRRGAPRGPRLEVFHVTVAAQTLEPAVLEVAAHLLDEDALDLVPDLVERLDPGVLAILAIK